MTKPEHRKGGDEFREVLFVFLVINTGHRVLVYILIALANNPNYSAS